MSSSATAGTLVSAALYLMMYSYLYKINTFFRIGEALFVGSAAGYTLAVSWRNINNMIVTPLLGGNMLYILPLIGGFMYFLFFIKKFRWLYRLPIVIILGSLIGVQLPSSMKVSMLNQLTAVIKRATFTGVDPITAVNNLILIVGVATTIILFSFTRKQTSSNALGIAARIGRYILMISLGNIFGKFLQLVVASLIATLQFLLGPTAWYVIPIAIAILVYGVAKSVFMGAGRLEQRISV